MSFGRVRKFSVTDSLVSKLPTNPISTSPTGIDHRYDPFPTCLLRRYRVIFQGYGPASYKAEVQGALDAMRSQGLRTQSTIIAPNVNRDWTLEDIFNTNFLVDFAQELAIITVEKYATVYPHFHRFNLFV